MLIFGYYLVFNYENNSLWSLINPEDAALGLCVYSLSPMPWCGGVFFASDIFIALVPYAEISVWHIPDLLLVLNNYFYFLRLPLQYEMSLIFITFLTAIVWTLLHFLMQLPIHTSGFGCPFSLSDSCGGCFLHPSVRACVCSSSATNFLFLNWNFGVISDDSPSLATDGLWAWQTRF